MRNLYAVALLLLCVAGEIVAVVIAERSGNAAAALAVAGLAISLIVAPAFHELGHVLAGKIRGMRVVLVKFFCFRFSEKEGKIRFSLASPFLPEETQMCPEYGGNMRRRASVYTAGGLVLEGVLLLGLVAAACFTAGKAAFLFWGAVPYAAYLFLLNGIPAVYAGGKTDACILSGIAKNRGPEKTFVYAMEIYGRLSEGKSFAEIDKKYFFDLPQIAENEPMYAIILYFRYRRYLETEEREKAADCLNRLAALAEPGYLYPRQIAGVAAELGYMHLLNGDTARSEACEAVLSDEEKEKSAAFCRLRALRCAAEGDASGTENWKKCAEDCLRLERVKGMQKSERILLSRIVCRNPAEEQ